MLLNRKWTKCKCFINRTTPQGESEGFCMSVTQCVRRLPQCETAIQNPLLTFPGQLTTYLGKYKVLPPFSHIFDLTSDKRNVLNVWNIIWPLLCFVEIPEDHKKKRKKNNNKNSSLMFLSTEFHELKLENKTQYDKII